MLGTPSKMLAGYLDVHVNSGCLKKDVTTVFHAV